jgi:hypothetical protein
LANKLLLNLYEIYKKIWYNSLFEEKKMKFNSKFAFILILLPFLFQSGCKLFKVYDIVGTWEITRIVNGEETTFIAEFDGSRESGAIYVGTYEQDYGLGSYYVEYDDQIIFIIAYFKAYTTTTSKKDDFEGGFDGKNTMSGTLIATDVGTTENGEWRAVRVEETF